MAIGDSYTLVGSIVAPGEAYPPVVGHIGRFGTGPLYEPTGWIYFEVTDVAVGVWDNELSQFIGSSLTVEQVSEGDIGDISVDEEFAYGYGWADTGDIGGFGGSDVDWNIILTESPSLAETSPSNPVTTRIRLIPFIYSADIAYMVELGNEYMRFFYGDTVLVDDDGTEVWIESPYLTEHLFELQHRQVGDTMWITHPLYAPRKLTRSSATLFALSVIKFRNGPFLLRNDLIDPYNASGITMTSSVTGEATGTAEYSINSTGRHGSDPDNDIKQKWWDGIAAHGVDGSQADYCGGGADNSHVECYITYTVTYAEPIESLTQIFLDYCCMSSSQGSVLTEIESTHRGLRVMENGAWTTVISPEVGDSSFPATPYFNNPAKLVGCDGTATITGTWTNVTKIEIYLYAEQLTHHHRTVATAIFNVRAETEEYIPGTLTASEDYFEDDHIGSLFKLVHKRPITSITLNAPGYSPSLYTKGTFRFGTHGTWTGTVELERNDNDAGWDTYRTYIAKNDRNIQESFVEEGDNVQYRIYIHPGTTGLKSEVTLDNVFREGIVRIVAVDSATVAQIAVITPLAFAEPTKRWAEGAWNDLRGYPISVTFFEDRCVYGGMQTILPSEAKLLTAWLSETGDYENFDEGVNAADSFSITVPSANDLMWIDSLEALILGTSGDEWRIGSNKMEQLLTPTNVTVKQQASYGSAYIQTVRINDRILFVDSVGRKIRELMFDGDKYIAMDLCSLAEHITSSGITSLAYQRHPDSIIWATLDDGSLILMAYDREQDVVAWAKCPTNGIVQSVCIVPGEAEDVISLAVQRTLTGAIVYYASAVVTYEGDTVTLVEYGIYIEQFAQRAFGSELTNAFFVDCGLTITNSPAASTISGLDHLEGETIEILSDGVVMDAATVSDGAVTAKLAGVATVVSQSHVGLPYTAKVQPMRIVMNTPAGSSMGSITKVSELVLSLRDSCNVQYGAVDTDLYPVDLTAPELEDSSEITGLYTGDVPLSFDGGFSVQSPIIVVSSDPTPFNLRAIVARMEQSGR